MLYSLLIILIKLTGASSETLQYSTLYYHFLMLSIEELKFTGTYNFPKRKIKAFIKINTAFNIYLKLDILNSQTKALCEYSDSCQKIRKNPIYIFM